MWPHWREIYSNYQHVKPNVKHAVFVSYNNSNILTFSLCAEPKTIASNNVWKYIEMKHETPSYTQTMHCL